MSEPKIISPLLDGYTLGTPISEHHGVICCPAIKENTSKKYIVKIISVPANQAQFDAMLFAGAYKDPGDAMEYFREKGENILNEAELLKTLSKIEGFLPYDGWQMEPITRRRLGYEVYLVGSYKRSLDRYIRKNPFTQLEAVNLGLDLCSALSVCRQAGFLYVDLKPSNIYVSERKEYRIGDLGFISMDSLRYASLPERYFGPYTPPELLDPMSSMNLTVDTYAVGMILYQLYNDGNLPFMGFAPSEELPSPCNADYEMAEIIMKSIHTDPEQRWTDPKDLGKAIASYMQRNTVNDIPITPFIPLDVKPEDIVVLSSEETEDPIPADAQKTLEAEAECITDKSEDCTLQLEEVSFAVEESSLVEETFAQEETSPVLETEESASIDAPKEESSTEETLTPAEGISQDQNEEETLQEEEISEEVAKIISRADEIIAHEIPEETVFVLEETMTDPFAFAKDDSEEYQDSFPDDPLVEDESPVVLPKQKKKAKSFENTTRKTKIKKFFSGLFKLLILCIFCGTGFWYYQNVFLQTIDSIVVSGTQDEITVLIDTQVEESQLTVSCIDSNGKQKTTSVQGGKATFSDLNPSTQYAIQLDIDGFHKLTGETSDVFTTDAPTQIVSFQAIAGSEDGSVLLNFTVDGNEPDFWNIRYFTEGEEERLETVTGHSAMITGLTVGKVYTFTVDGGQNFDLDGEKTLQFLASRLILAEDLMVTSADGSEVILTWKARGDVVVDSWNVRFYDGYGFEEQITVTDSQAVFDDVDPASHYTIEITAAGMTMPSTVNISADPIIVSDFQIDESNQTEMKVTWKYSGNVPEGGWQLMYAVDGSGNQLIPCDKPSAKISPLIPGASYQFILLAQDGRTVYNNSVHYQTKEAESFTANNFVLENVSIDLLKTPEEPNWNCEMISEDAFTTSFQVGDSASMVLRSSSTFYLPGSKTNILFVFRDSYGNVLPEYVCEISEVWKNIWSSSDPKTGEIDIPALPPVPGQYLMDLYFDGCLVAPFEITITE